MSRRPPRSSTHPLALVIASYLSLFIACSPDDGSIAPDSGPAMDAGLALPDAGEVSSDSGATETDARVAEIDTGAQASDPLEGLSIDLDSLLNYASQPVPAYITRDNTPPNNPITDIGATLGRVLFYDPLLSTTGEVSCASCHQQAFAFSDPRPLSPGVDGLAERHSMRLVNIRFAEAPNVRWDRAAESVEEQMILPIRNAVEMGFSGVDGAPSLQDLAADLQATSYYPVLFEAVFGDPQVTEDRMARALAQFVRSIQSFDSKYDVGRAQVSDDRTPFPNFTADENAGKRLFIDDFEWEEATVRGGGGPGGQPTLAAQRVSGGLNCGTCHRPPEFDIDPMSRNNGLIANALMGPGQPRFDLVVTRSPSLRDLTNTQGRLNGGVFHVGRAMNLGGVRAHYNFRPIDPNNNNLDPRMMPGGLPPFLGITNQEAAQLSAFLETLAGTRVYTDERWSNPFIE